MDGKTASLAGPARPYGPAAMAGASLFPAWPNPFNGETRLSYRLARPSAVRLSIYSVSGRRVRVVDTGFRTAGTHGAPWDGRDEAGRPVSPGIYFARLETADERFTEKVILLR